MRVTDFALITRHYQREPPRAPQKLSKICDTTLTANCSVGDQLANHATLQAFPPHKARQPPTEKHEKLQFGDNRDPTLSQKYRHSEPWRSQMEITMSILSSFFATALASYDQLLIIAYLVVFLGLAVYGFHRSQLVYLYYRCLLYTSRCV